MTTHETQRPPRRGTPIVVSAPSGGGKTTLCRRVMRQLQGIAFSVSHTTRAPRGSEQDGVDYHFVSDAEFDALIGEAALLEWAHVHDRRYGTDRRQVEEQLAQGVDVFFDIDVQGGRQIAAALPGTVLVFVLPPTMQELERRLRGRGSDHSEQIERRLRVARHEIEAAQFYTHWIINDDLDRATAALAAIVQAERQRCREPGALVGWFLGETT